MGLVVFLALTVECKRYDMTPKCDFSKYGSKCYTMDPFPVIKKVCVSKLYPSIVLYNKTGLY